MCNTIMTSTRNANTAGAAFNGDYVTTLTATTKDAASNDRAPKKVIDTRNLSEEDLEALKKQDPFLYYSIPRPGRAADVTTQRNQEAARSCSRRASCPSRVQSSSSTMVERKSCISVECDLLLLWEDFMDDTELDSDVDGVDLDTNTLFDQLLLRHKRQQQQ